MKYKKHFVLDKNEESASGLEIGLKINNTFEITVWDCNASESVDLNKEDLIKVIEFLLESI